MPLLWPVFAISPGASRVLDHSQALQHGTDTLVSAGTCPRELSHSPSSIQILMLIELTFHPQILQTSPGGGNSAIPRAKSLETRAIENNLVIGKCLEIRLMQTHCWVKKQHRVHSWVWLRRRMKTK